MPSTAEVTERSPTERVVLITRGGNRPGWYSTEASGPHMEVVDSAAADIELGERLAGAGAIIIDAGVDAPLSLTRRAHRLVAAAQLVIVASGEELQDLNRSMLFTPGIGEVWVVESSDATPALFEQAAAVGAKRRRHARRSGEVSRRVARLEPSERPRIMADQYLAVLLELLPDPVLALGEDDELLFRNPAAAEVLHLGRGERIDGGELRRRLAPAELPRFDTLLEEARQGISRAELKLGGSSEARTYDAVAAPVRGERPVRALVLRDVTQQVHAREQLQIQAGELARRNEENQRLAAERAGVIAERDVALEELREAVRRRSRFYSSMSHELRTPINAIIGYNELLREGIYGELPENQHEPLGRIKRAANHLLELVNDVLDLSKLEAGKLVLEPSLIDLDELLTDVRAIMGPLAEQNDVELKYDVDAGCAEGFVSDPRRLRQIVTNLLSNAIRYAPGAPVDVRCATSEGRLAIEVEDRGPGIAEDKLQTIFEEFMQVGNTENGGTGLGLPIARTLARALGGDIHARSEPGKGSVFRLEVPPLEESP